MDEDRPTSTRRLLVSVWAIAALQILALVAAQDIYNFSSRQRLIIGQVILIPAIAITAFVMLGRRRKGK